MKRFNYVIDAPSVEILLAQIYDESQDVNSGDLALVLMLLSTGNFLGNVLNFFGEWDHSDLCLMSRTILYISIDVAVSTADHRILQCLVTIIIQVRPLVLTRSLVPTGLAPFLAIM